MEKASHPSQQAFFGIDIHTSCNVIDEEKQFRVKIDVTGIKKNEIKLSVTENSLKISAEYKEESEEKKKNYLKKECGQAYLTLERYLYLKIYSHLK